MSVEDKRFWYLTRGTEWIPIQLDDSKKVYIHNFSLGYVFDDETMGYDKYMTMCSIPSYANKPVPEDWSEAEKEKLNNEIIFAYAVFLKTFVKCDEIQYDRLSKEFRLSLGDDKIRLSDSDMKKIFSEFKIIYCIGNSEENVPWKNAKPRNKEDEEFLAIMRAAKMKIDEKKNGKFTIDSIAMGVATKHYSYNLFNIWDLTMWQLMETHSKMYENDNSYFTKIGIYTGSIDTKKNKINPSELSWSTRD